MGKAAYKLQKAVRREEADIQAAARKRGLWGSIGSTLGSVLAMAVTGGAAAPWAAGLLAGGLSYAGGKLGSGLAKASGAKIEGKGKFLSGQRSDIARNIEDQIGANAMKTGLMAGMSKLAGGALKYGKDGFSATVGTTAGKVTEAGGEVVSGAAGEAAKGGFQFGDIFQGKDVATQKALAGQTGIGKALDFRGSWLGGEMAASKSAKLAQEFSDKGYIDPTLQDPTSRFTDVFPDDSGKSIVAMDRLAHAKRQNVISETFKSGKDILDTGEGSISALGPSRFDDKAINIADFEYAKPSKVDVPAFSASEAHQSAIMGSKVPSEYGAPRGVTWGETAVDPGRSDMSYALPDQGGGASLYTGDTPSLMDMYGEELNLAQAERFEAAKNLPPMSKIDFSLEDIKKPGIITEGPQISADIPVGEGLTAGERIAYDKINQMSDAGYTTGSGGTLPAEYGEGFIDLQTGETRRPPVRPNVPVESDDIFFDEDIIVQDTDTALFPNFDEASWQAGKEKIQGIDANLAKQQYWGGGDPAVEGLSEGDTVFGDLSRLESTSFSPQYNFVKPTGQRARNLQQGLRWQDRLFGR